MCCCTSFSEAMVTYSKDTLWTWDLCLGKICCSKICIYSLVFPKYNVHLFLLLLCNICSVVHFHSRTSKTMLCGTSSDKVSISSNRSCLDLFSIMYTKDIIAGNKETKILTRTHLFVGFFFACSGVQHILCCVFFFVFFSSSRVPYAASFSRLSLFYCRIGNF